MLAVAFFQAAGVAGHEFTIHLIPETSWNDGPLKTRADTGVPPDWDEILPEGRILVFHRGEYRPRFVLEANVPHEVPSGDWFPVAEAPGYVSVVSGQWHLPEGAEPLKKKFVIPVAAACEVELRTTDRWQGVQRLDAVSLDRHAVYPIDLADRRRFHLPAGQFLAYTVDARGVVAISRIARCRYNDTHVLRQPLPPPADRQDLMISVRLPDEAAYLRDELEVVLEPVEDFATQAPLTPTAGIWAETRSTSFFLDFSAAEPFILTVRHPKTLTRRLGIAPLEGGVRELGDIELRQRVSLKLSVDYRPSKEHRKEDIVLLHCGAEEKRYLPELDPRQCREWGEPVDLEPGVQDHLIEDLDTGWYVPAARIDDEEILGLGSWFTVVVDETSPPVIESGIQTLEEFHIFGQLLLEDEPVAGEVLLEPAVDLQAPTRRFPTDDELVFHIHYFGEVPTRFGIHRLPETLRDRSPETLRGMFDGYRLAACDEDGFCRRFHRLSTLSGGGRMDLDLGGPREIRVEVVDARTSEAVVGAKVRLGRRGQLSDTFHFVDGESLWQEGASLEVAGVLTDRKGVARLRDVRAGEQLLGVNIRGYQRYLQPLQIPERGLLEVQAAIEPEERRGHLRLRFSGDRPVLGGGLLALRPDGQPDPSCTRGTNDFGEIDLPPRCLADQDRRFVFLHARGLVESFSAASLRQAGELKVRESTGLPLRLRLVDSAGQPLPRKAIQLQFDDFALGPDHFGIAMQYRSQLLPPRTDSQGTLTLPFVDPFGPLPRISLLEPDGPSRWVPISLSLPGERVDVTIDP